MKKTDTKIKNAQKERELIKKDLIEQLNKKGAIQQFYISLVDDYLSL